MKHARSDYDVIQDTSGKLGIPHDEPVFILRGQDELAGDTVRHWAILAREHGASDDIVQMARGQAALMDAWPKKKVPDVPDAKLMPPPKTPQADMADAIHEQVMLLNHMLAKAPELGLKVELHVDAVCQLNGIDHLRIDRAIYGKLGDFS